MNPRQIEREVRLHRTAFLSMMVMLMLLLGGAFLVWWPAGVGAACAACIGWIARSERQAGLSLSIAAQVKRNRGQAVCAELEEVLRKADIPFKR